MNQSNKFGVYFKIGTGCLLSHEANCDRVRFDNAGGTPLPNSKASSPPFPRAKHIFHSLEADVANATVSF